MNDLEFKAIVEVSRKWDGEEVARELSDKIKNKIASPKFILLFTTIHYEKEFEKILNGIKNDFPEPPLIGGTVAGFMTQEGCYTRGVTALAVEYENMDVAIGIGHNTKKNPLNASVECSDMLKKEIDGSNFPNKFLFVLTSGTIVPSLLGTGVKRVYKTKIPSSMLSRLLKTSFQTSQKGVGREDIILEEISKQMPEFNIIGGSSIDDNNMEKNYQFFNNNIYTNTVICLAIKTDKELLFDSQVAVEKTDKVFEAQLSGEKYIIKKIDNNPATKTFFEYLNWPDSFMDEKLHRRTFFYPILFEEQGEIFPEVIGGLIGNNIVCGFNLKSNNLCIGRSSKGILINAIKQELDNITKRGPPKIGIVIYCSALLETLGRDFYKVQESIKESYQNSPFLLIATGGEDFCIPNKVLKHSNETINMAAFI